MNLRTLAVLLGLAAAVTALATPARTQSYVPDWHRGITATHYGSAPLSPLSLELAFVGDPFDMTAAIDVHGVMGHGALLFGSRAADMALPWGDRLLIGGDAILAVALAPGRKGPQRVPLPLAWAGPILLGRAPAASLYLQAIDLGVVQPTFSRGLRVTIDSVVR